MNNAHSSESWFAITLQQHVPCVETCQITWIFLRMVGVYISPGLHWQNVSSDPSAKGQYVHSYNFQMKVFPTFFFLVQTNVSDYKTNLSGFLLFFLGMGNVCPVVDWFVQIPGTFLEECWSHKTNSDAV